jgi:hypothetical protein
MLDLPYASREMKLSYHNGGRGASAREDRRLSSSRYLIAFGNVGHPIIPREKAGMRAEILKEFESLAR